MLWLYVCTKGLRVSVYVCVQYNMYLNSGKRHFISYRFSVLPGRLYIALIFMCL